VGELLVLAQHVLAHALGLSALKRTWMKGPLPPQGFARENGV
jgi:hypothetical protein